MLDTIKMKRHLIFLLGLVILPSVLSTQCKSSTQGREFVFGILDSIDYCCHDDRNIVALDLTNVSPKDVRVRLQIPYFTNDTYFNIPHGENKTIRIDPQIQRDGTFVDKRGIRISSDNDVSVLLTNAFNSGAVIESYNILPVDALGKSYIISSFKSLNPDRDRGSIFLAAGIYNKTHIKLYNTSSAKEIYSTTINSNDIFQYLCPGTCDLTGMQVTSDKIVHITAGSTFVYDSSSRYYDTLGAAMIPTATWSNRYIVPPVLPKKAFMIRALSERSLVNMTISTSSKTVSAYASLTDHHFKHETVVVVADKSFSVTQYGIGNDNDQNWVDDAFMTVVPSVDQYINNYTFTVPQGYYNVTYYVAVIVPDIYKDDLLFDGIPRLSYKYPITVLNVPAPFNEYVVLTFQVDSGFHNFRQSFPGVNFGLFVYGLGIYRGAGLGNGFYAGMNFAGDCTSTSVTTDMTSATTPSTSSIESSTSSSQQTTQTTASSTTVMLTNINGTGPMCYVCPDLSHLYLCDRIEQCNQNEVCYLEKYVESGHTKYKSGCIDAPTCRTKQETYTHSNAVCFECCHGNFCNNQGCGEGIPGRDSRGPICLDCEHVASPEECFKVSPCGRDQVCRIEEYSWFGQSNFKMGCGQGACDPVVRSVSHIIKRAVPECHACCTDDYCNRNCTRAATGQGGPAIVG